jgi:hypothetical protein
LTLMWISHCYLPLPKMGGKKSVMKSTRRMFKALLGGGLLLLFALVGQSAATQAEGTIKQVDTGTTGILTVIDNGGDTSVPNGTDMNYLDSTLPSRGGVVVGDNVSFDIVAAGRLFIATNLIKIESATLISIDIKPGSFPNSISPRSKGTIPVAILSAQDFDATTEVDRNSLTFGRTGDEDSLHRGGRKQVPNCGTEDVNDDGLDDLVCHFKTQDTSIACGDTSASLKGATFDGQMIEGSDSIKTDGCK